MRPAAGGEPDGEFPQASLVAIGGDDMLADAAVRSAAQEGLPHG